MSNVVKLPKLVAWAQEPIELAPGWRDVAVSLSAILVPLGVVLRREAYLSLLGERIQRIVNACSDRQDATDALVEDLCECGLYPDVAHVPAGLAGAYLVASNPGTIERLGAWGVLPVGASAPTGEMPAAREAISADHYYPEDRLRSWAGLLGRLP